MSNSQVQIPNLIIIHLQYIKGYIRGDGGQIELQSGTIAGVCRRKKEEFLKAIGY